MMTVWAILILIFLGLAIYHYILENVLVPTEFKKIETDLVILRKKLALLKHQHGDAFNDELYDHLVARVENGQKYLSTYTLTSILKACWLLTKDETMLSAIDKRIDRTDMLLKETTVPGVRELNNRAIRGIARGIFWNAAGWLPYVLVAAMIWATGAILVSGKNYLKEKLSRIIKSILEMSSGYRTDRFGEASVNGGVSI